MNLVNPRPPSCSSRRDESVATENASIGARTKPYAPPEVSPLCTREIHAPPSDHRPPPQIHRSRRSVFDRSKGVLTRNFDMISDLESI
ncbi:hypothetical protein Bca4012_098864 [Brassica carinata]